MLTRFQTNVTRYPRLFTAWAALIIVALIENLLLPQLVGIQNAVAVDAGIALALAIVVYFWIFRNANRTSIFLDIINRFEGHEVCTVASHEPDVDAMYEEERLEENDEETL